MTEEKKKNRGWVKNAVIIFLAIMLVLTFFSNTIMNRSLPEVAVQTAVNGTINSQLRGTGTVTALSTYEVKIGARRTVQSVNVTSGQEVAPGDLLFTLSYGEESELDAAEAELASMRLEYQKALLSAADYDYTRENRNIQRMREDLEEKTAERDELAVSDEEYSEAQSEFDTARQLLSYYQGLERIAQSNLENAEPGGGGSGGGLSSLLAARNSASEEYSSAQRNTNAMWIQYGADYNILVAAAEKWWDASTEEMAENYDKSHLLYLKSGDETSNKGDKDSNNTKDSWWTAMYTKEEQESTGTVDENVSTLSKKDSRTSQENSRLAYYNGLKDSYLSALANLCNSADPNSALNGKTQHFNGNSNYANYGKAYTAITEAKNAEAAAKSRYDEANSAYNTALSEYNASAGDGDRYSRLLKEVEDAKQRTETAQANYDAAEAELARLDQQKLEYEAADESVKTQEQALEDAIFELSEQQKDDGKQQQLAELGFQEMRDNIAKQEELVASLKGGDTAGGNEIYAQVYGVVQSVNITAGNMTEPDTALAVIEVPDMGYQVEFSVSAEQARQVSVGDMAEISTSYWWGAQDISARLINIRTDPQNPMQSRILVFSVSGADVESGSQLTLAIGARSANYDIVVPNSAVRSDSNGSFVYIVEAKSSPLGNRYIAKRIDVQVAATDDVNSAVTGGVAYGDYVITTSTAPIEDGMYVKMPE